MKYIQKIQKFMSGRYTNADDLYRFLFWTYIILFGLNLFINNNFISILLLIILFIIIYRFFSKNIYRRTQENQKFLQLKKILYKPFKNFKRNLDDKNHIYKRCRKCKTILKLPILSKRGLKTAVCPHCQNKMKVLVFKKLKVEIIKKKIER